VVLSAKNIYETILLKGLVSSSPCSSKFKLVLSFSRSIAKDSDNNKDDDTIR
jgi:hypothetical protein